MEVSWNGGTPKSSILTGLSIINHPFLGIPYLWKHPYMWGYIMCIYIYNYIEIIHISCVHSCLIKRLGGINKSWPCFRCVCVGDFGFFGYCVPQLHQWLKILISRRRISMDDQPSKPVVEENGEEEVVADAEHRREDSDEWQDSRNDPPEERKHQDQRNPGHLGPTKRDRSFQKTWLKGATKRHLGKNWKHT